MLTYTSSSVVQQKRIEASTFAEYGLLPIDECYSVAITTASETTMHTLIHLKKRSRDTAVRKFITYHHEKNVEGVEDDRHHRYNFTTSSFSTSDDKSKLNEHPSFAILVEHFQMGTSSSSSFYSWVETAGLRGGGMLATFCKKNSKKTAGAKRVRNDGVQQQILESMSPNSGEQNDVDGAQWVDIAAFRNDEINRLNVLVGNLSVQVTDLSEERDALELKVSGLENEISVVLGEEMQPVGGGGGGGGLPTLPPMMTAASSSAASFSDVEYLDAHFKKYPRVGNEMMKASQQRFTAEQKTRKLEYELKSALSSKRSDVSSFESTSKALSSAMTKLKENKNEIFLYNRDLADVTRQFEELKEDYGTLQEANNQLRLKMQAVGREGVAILEDGDGFNLGAGEGGDFPLHDDDDAMVLVTQERDAASALVDSLTVERDSASALVITLRQERNAAMNERNSAVLLADRFSVERDTAYATMASLVNNRDFIQATLTAAEGDHAAIVMQKEQMLRMAEAKIADLQHQMVVARGGAERGR